MNYNYVEYSDEIIPNFGRVYHTPKGPYPSITTILGKTQEGDKKSVLEAWRARVGNKEADKITQAAATRGTNTHLMLERQLRGEDPRLHEFPKEHVALFHSLRLELKQINRWFGQEVVLFSDTLQIAGRCDLVAEYKGTLSIVDYKTSSRVKSADEIGDYWLQAAFYAVAHNEMFQTDINKLVILMGVENKLPLVFKKTLDDELTLKLITRVKDFYEKL